MPTHYQLLSLPPTATAEQIRRAYRTLAKSLHPDVNPSGDAVKKFSKLVAAYEVLSSPAKRKAYDRTLAAEVIPPRPPGPAHYSWDNIAAKPGPRKVDISEIDELYDTFFTKRRSPNGSPQPKTAANPKPTRAKASPSAHSARPPRRRQS